MLSALRRDLISIRDRDPAARSLAEVVVCYSGVHALWGHRLWHWLWEEDHKFVARVGSEFTKWLTGVEIHPAAVIGNGLFIDHASGVVIGETVEIGDDVTIYQGVTLGGTNLSPVKRHPTIGNRVTIGAGAKILGPITIGDGSRVGANAVVVKSVPADSVVVGVPGQIISRSRPDGERNRDDLESAFMPDLFGSSLQALLTRVDNLETLLEARAVLHDVRPSKGGVWSGEDFSI